MKFLKTIKIEGFHTILMFLLTIPFYLYGGNVLYGHRLLSMPNEVMAFTIRAAITVLIVEILFNWTPHIGLRLYWWRERWLHVILSGLMFAILTYFVLPPQYHEGEAFIGMGIVWVVSGVVVHLLFKSLGWYKREDTK
jgi:hypothetical protein